MINLDFQKNFNGGVKVGKWLLQKPEIKLIGWLVKKIPPYIRTYHLTLATVLWSILILLCGYLGKEYGMHWLWWINLLIILQWLTDTLDGAVGRFQNEGLIRWGYYMDHLLDYFFMSAVLISYMLVIPNQPVIVYFFTLIIGGGFMVNSYLSFAATNEFRISYFGIGPTEARIVLIILNSLIIIFGKTYLAFAFPYVLTIAFIALVATVYQTHKILWRMDKEYMSNQN